MPGGALASSESREEGALREAAEEAAIPPELVQPSHAWVNDHEDWSYTTVVASSTAPFEAYAADAESIEIRWVRIDEVDSLPLLPAFGKLWPSVRKELGRRLALVVDAANVVGSRPDGWWHDRAGAVRRLRDRLSSLESLPARTLDLAADLWYPSITMVAEGKARDVESSSRVDLVGAPRHGDDTIVDVVASLREARPDDHIVAVTADRELRGRIARAGARSIGPRTLLSAMPALP